MGDINTVDAKCPHCGHEAKYAEDLVGMEIPCRGCDIPFRLEVIEMAEAAPPPRPNSAPRGREEVARAARAPAPEGATFRDAVRKPQRLPSAREVHSVAVRFIIVFVLVSLVTFGIGGGVMAFGIGIWGVYVFFAQYYSVRRIEEQLKGLRDDLRSLR